eukprot:CAMPEP_0197188038 /NCGR_PEP_ID=MMETSP1423-20130617/17073_1 /TAXON_ID=476441 /ORGANISM="Pseudo-nitzschia heimii, Strain UNC1101" /LENGTH=506 /DNA_ID=CAMNT_0042639777 /DNA_START=93 /DNA_END=1613 /DNA_ORIENTATION=+
MKFLRRNDKRDDRRTLSHSEEILHLKAISLMEELEKMRREKNQDVRNQRSSELQHSLDPKRLLCFSGKSKDKNEEYDFHVDPNKEIRPWISEDSKTRTKHTSKGRELSLRDQRRSNGDIAGICDELCRDYYEIRKKLKNRPIVLTSKKFQTIDSTSGSNSTTSSFDAPMRKFHDDDKKKKNHRGRKHLHYSNVNRELHRQQPSLLDDKGPKHNQKDKKKSHQSKQKHSKTTILANWKSGGNNKISHKSKSNRAKNKKSENKKSNSLKSNDKKSNVVWVDSPEIKGSESTAYTIPLSFVEKKSHRKNIQPDLSMISTLTTSSYSTCEESSVILSPRGANDKVQRNLKPSREIVDSDLGLMCAPIACSSTQQQTTLRTNRNPSIPAIALANLGTITEGGAYASPSVSSSSFSSYSSSSSCSDGESYCSDSDGKDYDPSIIYGNDYAVKAIKATPKNRAKTKIVNGGCSIESAEMWNVFDKGGNSVVASNSIVAIDNFRADDRRDDYSR